MMIYMLWHHIEQLFFFLRRIEDEASQNHGIQKLVREN